MNIQSISLDKLITNPIQESKRTEQGNLRKLKLSIQQYGLLQPIAITKDLIVVDGHRRSQCYRDLGYKEIPCIIYNGEVDGITDIDLFIQTNGESKMNLNYAFYFNAYLKGGNVPNRILDCMMFIVSKTSRKFLKYLAKKGVSPLSIRQGMHASYNKFKLIDSIPFEFYCKWIIENKLNRFFTREYHNDTHNPLISKSIARMKADYLNGKITIMDRVN